MTHSAYVQPLYDEDEDVPAWEREPQSAVLGVYEAPRRPRWTKEPPTHEGAWYLKPPGSDSGIVVEVRRNERGQLVYGLPKVTWFPVRGTDAEWGDRACPEPT